jgi:SAM-dependent methyltransferase
VAVLDIGCGEGRLLSSLDAVGYFAWGIEPSRQMAERAVRRRVTVVQGRSEALPVRTGTIEHVVATYPGPWILDPLTWEEIARVTTPGASIAILLGGDYTRGNGAFVRSRLMRLAYGKQGPPGTLPELGHPSIDGGYDLINDRWGTAILWFGRRRCEPAMPASGNGR